MPFYETTLIIRPDVTQQEADKVADNFTSIAEGKGGKLVKKEYWGLRSLAYKINKNKKGHYYLLGLDAPSEAVAEITRLSGLNEDIMRNLNVKVDAISDEPSAILKEVDTERRR